MYRNTIIIITNNIYWNDQISYLDPKKKKNSYYVGLSRVLHKWPTGIYSIFQDK